MSLGSKFVLGNYRAPLPKVRLHRGESRIRGTHWRNISHATWEKQPISEEYLRDMLSFVRDPFSFPVAVEDPYRKGRFIDGFVMDHRLAVVPRNAAYVALNGYADLGKFSVIWPLATVKEGVALGTAAEVRPQARLEEGVSMGDRSVVNKYATIQRDTQVGAMVFAGAGVKVAGYCEVGTGSLLARGVQIGEDSVIGFQNSFGSNSQLGNDGFYDSGVRIGHDVRIGDHVMVGEGVQIANYTTVGNRVVIGAGNVIGVPGADKPTAFVDDRSFIQAVYERPDAGGSAGSL